MTLSTIQTLPNRIDNGATSLQFGATSGADSSDGLWPVHTGEDYVYLPGNADNRLSATVSLSGALSTLTYTINSVGFRSGGVATGATLPIGTGSSRFYLYVNNANQITLTTTDDATGSGVNSVANVTGLGDFRWLQIEFTPSGTLVRYRWSMDETSDRTAVTYSAWADLTTPGPIRGSSMTSLTVPFFGGGITEPRFWIAENGVEVAAMDPTEVVGQAAWVDSLGVTWTVVRGTTGYTTTIVDKNYWLLDGVDDRGTVPFDPDGSESFTVLGTVQVFDSGAATTFNRLFSTRVGAGAGAELLVIRDPASGIRSGAQLSDGTLAPYVSHASNRIPFGTLGVVGMSYNVDTDILRGFHIHSGAIYGATISTAGLGDISGSGTPTVGSSPGGANLFRGATTAPHLVMAGVPSDPELLAIAARLLAGSYS